MKSTSNGIQTPSSAVLFEKRDKLAIITLNRPKQYNAINHDLVEGLIKYLDQVAGDDNVRAILLTGNGKGFCAGADMMGFGNASPKQVKDYLNMYYGTIVRTLMEMPKPVICAINGPVAGAGLGLALACDFRVMAETANFRYAFINIGLGPDAGSSWFLARTVGYSKALEIAVEGKKIPAAECYRLGLTNKLVSLEELMPTALNWASQLADRPTIGFAATKRDMNFAMINDLPSTIAFEATQQMACLASEDHKEGVRAFLEKRKPNFVGK